MNLYEKIIAEYPELENSDIFIDKIVLQNDSDGVGDCVAKWDYSQPIPEGLTLGKPSA